MKQAADSGRSLILFAMKEEMAPFPGAARAAGWTTSGSRWDCRLSRSGVQWDVVWSGPGPANVKRVLQERKPGSVINPGFAGSLSPGLGAGDVVLVTRARLGPDVLSVEHHALKIAGLPEAQIVTAPAPLGARDKLTMYRHQAGDIVDMETWHVLDWCLREGVPFTGLRVVSDGLRDELPNVVKRSFDGERFRLGGIVMSAIFRPAVRRQLLELRRSSQKAADALCRALLEALESGTHPAQHGDDG